MATAKRRTQGRDAKRQQKSRKALPKVSTGIAGLDLVLGGGLPAGRVTLLSGGPGSGKSMIGLQCLLQGAANGRPGILVMFEERAEAVRQNASSRGWEMARLEKKNKLYLMDARLDPEAVISGEFSIKGLLAILDQQIKAMTAQTLQGRPGVRREKMDLVAQCFGHPGWRRFVPHFEQGEDAGQNRRIVGPGRLGCDVHAEVRTRRIGPSGFASDLQLFDTISGERL